MYQLTQQNLKNIKEIVNLNNQLQSSHHDCEILAKEESSLRSRESFLRSQIDQIYQENTRIRESLNAQITNLHQEVILLRSDIYKLHDENETTTNELRNNTFELSRTKISEEFYKRSLEEKTKLFTRQKSDFEDIVREIFKPKSLESQRAFEQILRVRSEIEHAENDKVRVLEQI